MPSRRILKIASRIQFLVTSVIQRELHDPRIGFVTILRVEPTEDLREAKIFYSVLGDSGIKSRTEHALEQAAGFIQREVARSLDTRVAPRLSFHLDETQDRVSRVERIISEALESDRQNREERGETESPEESSTPDGGEDPGLEEEDRGPSAS